MLEFENGFGFEDIKYKQRTQDKIQFGYGKINPNDRHAMRNRNKKWFKFFL